MSDEMDDAVKEFLVESAENLDQLDRDLLVLEREPQNLERLKSVFRAIHTIKGTCGFFGFGRLETVAHAGENLLSKLRDGALLLDPDRTSALLKMVDAIRVMLADIEKTGADGANDHLELVETLTRLQSTSAGAVAGTPPPTGAAAIAPAPQTVAVSSSSAPSAPTPQAIAVSSSSAPSAPTPQTIAVNLPAAPSPPAAPQPAANAPTTPPVAAAADTPAADALSESTIRVDVGLLDKMMNLVGELVLTRNQFLQLSQNTNEPAFQNATQRLNLITTELQEGATKTRMQPIGTVWNRFPRVVRDLALSCKKQIRVEMEGKDTELDKSILEAIKDPLTHIVRNSVDHGIEMPEVRLAHGKPAEGCLSLRAYHEGGQVNIEISDDGGGIDPEKIKRKALEKGLISADEAARMTDRDAVQLIFLPGFSTAEKVTNISGRGVGMDVVKTNVEKIGGTVEIQSRFGQGTALKVKIPLTLAIIPALIVRSGGARYAIPQVNLVELVRLDPEVAKTSVETIRGTPVYRLRGQLLPLVDLQSELTNGTSHPPASQAVHFVVLRADDHNFGLVVDGVHDTEEIVVKPLGKHLQGLRVYAGATILGDGRVALILDVPGIAERAGLGAGRQERALASRVTTTAETQKSTQTFLLLDTSHGHRAAIPMRFVDRLEEFARERIEVAEGRPVVQYRDTILPVVDLTQGGVNEVGEATLPSVHVVVCSHEGAAVGLLVEKVHDIVEVAVHGTSPSGENDHGPLVVQGRVIDLLDVSPYLAEAAALCGHASVTV